MKNAKKNTLLVIFVFISIVLTAQDKILIRGTVIASNDKLPLIGATVVEENSDNRIISSTVTNFDGNFSLVINDSKNTLSVSYVGYQKKKIIIGTNRNFKIELNDNNKLEEVTIIAKQKQSVGALDIDERDISMAISKLSAADIGDLQVTSIDEAMQGRMAGVDIVANAGDPGSGMSIRIRGTTSISGDNQPLIVVDGVPLETEIGQFDFSTATEEDFSQLLNIAPNDIEEIVVLKDAAANAIWGSRAANGVLQITTKRGSISPPKITFRTTASYSPLTSRIPTLSGKEYTTLVLEANANAGIILDPLLYPEFAYDVNNPVYYYNYSQNTDWLSAVERPTFSQQYDLAVRGGTSKLRYSISAGYSHNNGNTLGTSFDRINTRTNLDYFVSDKLNFHADISFTHGVTEKNYENVRGHAYSKMPNMSIYYIDEFGEQTPTFFTPVDNKQGSYPSSYNPVAMALYGQYTTTADVILPKLSLTFRPNELFRFTSDVSYQTSNNKIKMFLPQSATGLLWTEREANKANDGDKEGYSFSSISRLFFTPKFEDEKKHRLIAMLGSNIGFSRSFSYSSQSTNLPNEWFTDPSILSKVTPGGSISSGSGSGRSLSSYVNVNYTLLDKYIIYGNLNLNGSSNFGREYRFGLFPAVSARYRLSGEKWFKNWKWLDDFSLRTSWGISGKAPDASFYNRYSTYSWTYGGEQASYSTNLELSELRWEKSITTNYGFNLQAFKNKLNIEGEYYTRTVQDQWSDEASLPTTSGFTEVGLNQGVVQNRGWEINVNFTPVQTKELKVNIAFNVARNENVIKEISQYRSLESGNWDQAGSYLSRIVLNKSVGSFFGYIYNGVYLNEDQTIARDANNEKIYTTDINGNSQPVYMRFGYPTYSYQFKPGDAKYVDVNHDGNINYQDIVWLGDKNPLFTGGFTPSIRWKDLTLNTVFFFRYGNYIKNSSRMNLEAMYGFNNQSTAVLKRWTHPYDNIEDAPSDLLPRAMVNNGDYRGYNWLASSRYVEDGSFVRWKSLTLKYNFKRDALKKLGLTELYLYGTVNNLFVWTKYTGQDPEVNLSSGEDNSRTPVAKQFTLGLNLAF
ncbi:MAG: SusC/RagA family TonB-linked outer membrane protein [Paludibacter sp.]|nr:SusC/RagA family TonB-linked outer membrane protein [Paludibacter sp.]